MLVLHVCAEVYPLLKTGGLADVTAALPSALIARGCDVRLLLPGFPAVCAGVAQRRVVATLPKRFGAATIRLTLGLLANGVQAYVIEAPELYDRPGNPYADADNHAYADNHRRFALLGWSHRSSRRASIRPGKCKSCTRMTGMPGWRRHT